MTPEERTTKAAAMNWADPWRAVRTSRAKAEAAYEAGKAQGLNTKQIAEKYNVTQESLLAVWARRNPSPKRAESGGSMTAQTYKDLRALAERMDEEGQHRAASMLSEYLDVKGKPKQRGRPRGR